MRISVKVKPTSRTDEISRDENGLLRVKIKAPPVDGKANKYLLEYFSKLLHLPKSKIKLLKGETSQFKELEIEIEEKEFKRILDL